MNEFLKSIRLRFPDPELEKAFLQEYTEKGLGLLRLNILLAIIIRDQQSYLCVSA